MPKIIGPRGSNYVEVGARRAPRLLVQIYEYTGIALGIASADVRAGSELWKERTDKRVFPPARQIPE